MTVTLDTYDGERYQLPMLLEWDVIYTGSVPCDSISLVCLYDSEMAAVLPKATRFLAEQDGKTVLRGVVDAYEISFSQEGLLATLEGRGMAALLLDNESEAITYVAASLPDILHRHVSPYGISAETPHSVSGTNYTVVSGSSQWKALQGFTHRFGGFDPHFDRNGTLILAPLWGSGERMVIHDNTPLLSLKLRQQRHGVISEVLIQDKVQQISHRVLNQDFIRMGGQRRHILYMPRSTAVERRYTGEYQIEQSRLDQLEIFLELPFAFAAFPGDNITLSLTRAGLSGSYEVVESRSRMNSDGETTCLTISTR